MESSRASQFSTSRPYSPLSVAFIAPFTPSSCARKPSAFDAGLVPIHRVLFLGFVFSFGTLPSVFSAFHCAYVCAVLRLAVSDVLLRFELFPFQFFQSGA